MDIFQMFVGDQTLYVGQGEAWQESVCVWLREVIEEEEEVY